ncbi:MAG: hypothetical protein KDA84_07535, partial [Planctomycetaceae bacterium]|nr:hypothetical protein [Planctomycetaceae bacterium]
MTYSNHYLRKSGSVQLNSRDEAAWRHAFITYDGSGQAAGVAFYLDGQCINSGASLDALAGSINAMTPLSIGSRFGRYRVKGMIDDVRIYDRKLNAEEV